VAQPWQILQSIRTQVATRRIVTDEVPGRLRQQHLTAVTGRHHPRRSVNVKADVVTLDETRFTGVQPHPHPHGAARRPTLAGERPLTVGGGADGVARRRERNEQRVSLRSDLATAVCHESRPKQLTMGLQQRRIGVARPPQEPGRPLNVCEQEGDRATRNRVHPRQATPPDLHRQPRRFRSARPCFSVADEQAQPSVERCPPYRRTGED
jgi:hypothetical protein